MRREVTQIVDKVLVTIYDRPVKNEQKTEAENVPIYDNRVYIRKKAPNSRDIYDQPISSKDREKYADLLGKFEAGEKVAINGTPIEMFPLLDPAQVRTLQDAGVLTVQSLAELTESGMHRLPRGYMDLKYKAKKWLDQSVETDELRQSNEELKAQNADLLKRIEALEASKVTKVTKKRGRPRKTA